MTSALAKIALVAGCCGLALTGCTAKERRYRAKDLGAATLVRSQIDRDGTPRTVWRLIYDDDDTYTYQIAASRTDARGKAAWRDQVRLKLCVGDPVAGVRIRAITVRTAEWIRRNEIDHAGC